MLAIIVKVFVAKLYNDIFSFAAHLNIHLSYFMFCELVTRFFFVFLLHLSFLLIHFQSYVSQFQLSYSVTIISLIAYCVFFQNIYFSTGPISVRALIFLIMLLYSFVVWLTGSLFILIFYMLVRYLLLNNAIFANVPQFLQFCFSFYLLNCDIYQVTIFPSGLQFTSLCCNKQYNISLRIIARSLDMVFRSLRFADHICTTPSNIYTTRTLKN